jgi:probable blue pigment (indigoidine) exporter
MEESWRWVLVTAVAPVAWGTNYWVTRHALPPDYPLYGALIRALPAGLLLFALRPRLPRGAWWWRSAVLGAMNVGAFFTLIYISAQLLATSVASMIMATSPIAILLLAWLIVAEPPRVPAAAGALLGIGGVVLMLAGGGGAIDPLGVLASVTAMTLSSIGYLLAKRWGGGVDVLTLTAWQLIAGGALLAVAAVAFEGSPPPVDATSALGFLYVSLVATALAFACWFTGLRRLEAGTVGLVGLLNPVTGVLLGTLLAGEALGPRELVGIALVFAGILLGQPALGSMRARAARASRIRRSGRGVARRRPDANVCDPL